MKNMIFKKGFSILEISIALLLISILLYGVSTIVQTMRGVEKKAENTAILTDAYNALITFAQVQGYLPCPDTTGDGLENRSAVGAEACTRTTGELPFKMLGIEEVDAWDQPLYYAVNQRASDDDDIGDVDSSASYFNRNTVAVGVDMNAPFFRLHTPPLAGVSGIGNYIICAETASICDGTTLPVEQIEMAAIAVVVSFGENGAMTWAGESLDVAETENADNDLFFWHAQGSSVAGNVFDDQMIWITAFDLKSAILRTERSFQP
ncbi:hypothetical protein MNBD_GAMMA03-1343 [hydrothermal vent metagenome]|uniref:Prepilin-type N-terminal cleavage/methylation domain-containing protein n=1 Tax=hydrothermal vent metagenome TaxID=652676 RepID=A0A3B0W5G3_9ZZZZ